MSSCLGLYIEENLIKYAKVTKDKDNLKVDSFGIKFYEKIGEAINQIIAETYSYRIPISINLSEETYNYFYFFNLLNKNDLKKAIETEFSSYCIDKGYNRNALESRYALVQDMNDKEKIKAIYVSANKTEINKKIQEFGENPIYMITSLPMAIANVAEIKKKESIAIVNLESTTTVTTVVNGSVYQIDKIEQGMDEVLSNINMKENSYSKAYEICKNSTIYTMEGKELLQEEETNSYLEDIMPTLYNIAVKVKELLSSSLVKVDKVYITGTGSVINNVDLYFQEYLTEVKCEVLRPYFISNTVKINMKDYIEVNSAIALALQGLGFGVKELNFKKQNIVDQLRNVLTASVGAKDKGKGKSNSKGGKNVSLSGLLSKINFSFDLKNGLKGGLDHFEKWLLRVGIAILEVVIVYSVISTILTNSIQEKTLEAEKVRTDTTEQIRKADNDLTQVKAKTTKYSGILDNLKNYDTMQQQSNSEKDKIPNMLVNIMSAIPEGVVITSIENTQQTTTDGKTVIHMVINVQSTKYDLLGIFIGTIKDDVIMRNVISTPGVNDNGTIKIVIEGDLP